MTRPNKQQLRKLWFKVHKWLGLGLALPALLIFLSGSVLVWKSSVDDLLHPQRRVNAAAAQPPAFYLAAMQRALRPDERIASLTYPEKEGAVILAVRVGDGASMESRLLYYLHPVTGAVLDRAPQGAGPLGLARTLHGSLFLGTRGGKLVGMIAMALLLSAFSGLWLWWPMRGPVIRGLRWNRTQSRNANLHHQAGYWLALPLMVLSLTGATVSLSQFLNRVTGQTEAARAEAARALAAPRAQPRLNLAQVLTAAVAPSASAIGSITWPTVQDSRWIVSLRDRDRATIVAVDDNSGKAVVNPAPRSETATRLMRRIHDGTGMPFAWQIVIFVSGLLGATMAVTGVIMWVKGEVREVRMRRQRAERKAR